MNVTNVQPPALRPVRDEKDNAFNWDAVRSFFNNILKKGGLVTVSDLVKAKLTNDTLVSQVSKPIQQYVISQVGQTVPVTTSNGPLILFADDGSGRKWILDSVTIDTYVNDSGATVEQPRLNLREI